MLAVQVQQFDRRYRFAESQAHLKARLDAWESEVQEIVKHHHDQTPLDEHRVSCAIVRLADDLANQRGIGYWPGEAPIPGLLHADLGLLELDGNAWESACKLIEEAVDRVLENFARVCG